jgi:molecular chaperone GrpE
MSRGYYDPWAEDRRWPRRPVVSEPPPIPRRVPVRRYPEEPVEQEDLAQTFESPREPAPMPDRPAEVARDKEPIDTSQLRQAMDELTAARRRVERDAERSRDQVRAEVIDEMLPVLDDLDRSIAAGATTPDPALLEGIKLVRSQFDSRLARLGLERIDCVGQPFDPNLHEAIAVVDVADPAQRGVVVDEVQRGYRMGDKVVRAPRVRVGRAA